jgi:hypothetical protein
MKKALLSLVLVSIFASSFAQFIEKGSVIANGSFSFYSTKFKESEYKYMGFEIMPWAGYFVADNFTVGLMIEFDFAKIEGEDSFYGTTVNKNTDILVGPVLRYYLDNGFFVHGDVGFGKSKSKYEYDNDSYPDSESEYDITQIRIGIGYAFRITDTVFFDPIVGYKTSTEKYESGDDTESGIFAMGSFTIKIK